MAGFDIKANLFADLTKWSGNLKKAAGQADSFGKASKKVSGVVKAAWAGVAFLAFGAVGDAIKEVTKAAADDAKSQRILAGVVANNIKGSQKYTAQIEEQIGAWQLMAAVQDDEIRPAYGYLIRATKSVAKSNKLMQTSLDLAAGAHIDVKAAASALGRAYNGNLTALNKLVPGVKNLKDPLAEVQRRFKGLAEIEGKNDPFMKINIVMDEFKEKLGTAVLPLVQQFADYMASPEFQKSLDGIVAKVQKFGEWFASPEGQEAFKGWMEDLRAVIKLAGDFLDIAGKVASLLDDNKKNAAYQSAISTKKGKYALDFSGQSSDYRTASQIINQGSSNLYAPPTINVKVNPITGDAVAELLRGSAKRKGIAVGKMIQ